MCVKFWILFISVKMAALIGHLSGFDGNSESWTCYQDRLAVLFSK
jgi:hypothetical protein